MRPEDYKVWSWINACALGGALFLCAILFLQQMRQSTEIAYACNSVFFLQQDRDVAVHADVATAAERLQWVSTGSNAKQTPGSPLDRMCNLQRTNVIRDILIYLRTKTGEDLGENPEPWVRKYAPKK